MESKQRFDFLAELLEYPVAERDIKPDLVSSFMEENSKAATYLGLYFTELSDLSLSQQQEMFVRTFDMNPSCALEIGWHLFGEDYKRGELLAYLRGRMRSVGIEEGTELPDYLGNVLRLLGRWKTEEAAEFVKMFVNPALQKIKKAMSELNTPYTHLFEAIDAVCSVEFPISHSECYNLSRDDSAQLERSLLFPNIISETGK
ncbi:MAG: nitrate reductase molybdenum cofactor assembly chaperone [bacterium]